MSLFTHGRSALRAAAVVAVAATSLAGASAASAAMDNGKTPTFANKPNLQSVTLTQGVNNTNATFTFDKPVDVTNTGGFSVFGYNATGAGQTLTGTGATRTGSSVTVLIPGTPDPNEITGGTVVAGAVNSTTAGSGLTSSNIGDSKAATGSLGESGTRGHTTAPDLVSVRNSGSNTLTYVFDEDVKTAGAATLYTVVDAAGSSFTGTGTPTTRGPEVVVQFAGAFNVANARQASVASGAATNAFNNASVPGNADIAGQSNTTDAPVLVSAEVVGANQIRYTYTSAVTAASMTAFRAVQSTGVLTNSTSVVVNGTTALATFASFDAYREFLVAAADIGGAVKSTTGASSPPSGKPAGGNAGAKATGYTTGPDAVKLTASGNNAVVTVDNRLKLAPPFSGFTLLNQSGDTGPTAVAANATLNGAPGATDVTLTFASANQVTDAGAVSIAAGTLTSTNPIGSTNVQQAIGK